MACGREGRHLAHTQTQSHRHSRTNTETGYYGTLIICRIMPHLLRVLCDLKKMCCFTQKNEVDDKVHKRYLHRPRFEWWKLSYVHRVILLLYYSRFVQSELNWTDPDKSTQLYYVHDEFISHARQRHDLIGCSEIRTVVAQPVLYACIPMRVVELEFSSV